LSFILTILALVIAGLVAATQYFKVTVPVVTELVMRDPIASLLVAVVLALIARGV
jgi:hypothetical protein